MCRGDTIMKKKTKTTIKIDQKPVALGHQSHDSGSGVHDSRPKRKRTRKAQEREWKEDQDG